MKNIEDLLIEIDRDIKENLTESRYQHSVGVMHRAEELAIKYDVDIDKARLIGLAHDIAKDLTTEQKMKYVKDNHIEIDEIEKINIELLHSKIGADICQKKYKFSEDMVNAIKYHTTGNPNMDDLAKILFIADKTEDGRKYLDWNMIKNAEDNGINEILIYILDMSIKYTIDKKRIMHPDSINTRNKFLIENIKQS